MFIRFTWETLQENILDIPWLIIDFVFMELWVWFWSEWILSLVWNYIYDS
jgi:hypothetical protein